MGHENEAVDLSRRRGRDQRWRYRAWKDVVVVVVVAAAAAVVVVVVAVVAAVDVAVVDFSSFVVEEPSFHQCLER